MRETGWSGRANPFARWPGHRVLMFDPDARRAVEARALAACFAFAGLVTAGGTAVADISDTHRAAVFVIVAIALTLAALLAGLGEHLPEFAADGVLLGGTVLVTIGLGLAESGAQLYSVFYVWVGGVAFYFLPRWRAVLQLVIIASSFGLYLMLNPISQGGAGWVMILGSAVVCGLVVMTLREALELSDHRFEHAFSVAPIGIALVGLDGGFIRVNDAVCELLDRTEQELLSLRLIDIWHPEDEPAARAAVARAERDPGVAAELEHRYVLPSGKPRWARTNGSVICDDDGRPLYGLLQIADVTEQREAGEVAARLAAIVESSEDAVISTDLEGRITSWNAAATALYGSSSREMAGRPFATLIPAELQEQERQTLLEVISDRRPRAYETRRIHQDGSLLEVSMSVSPVYEAGGALVGTARVSRDISARRRIELALAESEERYRDLFERSPVPMWVHDRDTLMFLAVNDAATRQYGYSREEFLRMTVKQMTMSGESEDSRHTRRDGSILEVEVTSADHEFDGRAGVLVVAKDVTVERRDRAALARSEERYRMIIETAAEGIWMIDANDRTVFVNPRMAELMGYEASAMIGRPVESFMDAEGIRMREGRRQSREAGELRQSQAEQRLIRGDGTVVQTLLAARSLTGADGEHAGVLAMVSDVTDRVKADQAREQLEKQLNRSQRLEGIGRLAGGIAHDFNNLLAVILNYAEFVVEGTEDRPAVRDDAEEIRKAAERAASLTQQLLVFSRREVTKPQVLDLEHVVKSVERLLQRTIGEDVALEVEFEPATPPVCADRGQLEQLLLNLVVNARDAMPEGGRLEVSVDALTIGEGDGESAPPGEYARLRVCDTGAGIPPETLDHIFEPFFTTKGSQEGSGLGLATVYGIATQQGGHVDVSSQVGEGTTFRVLLPAAERTEDATPHAVEPRKSRGGTEKVLLVEDEPPVRNLTARILRAGGYEVVEAADGEEALRLEGGEERIDLMLTDLVMPGMSGKELADAMSRRRPGLGLLFMSGYTDDVVLRNGVMERQIAFLEKPFSSGDLLDMVRDTLDGTPAGADG